MSVSFAENVTTLMQKCLDDKLIIKETRQGCRGKLAGKLVDAYCVPDKMVSTKIKI